MKHYRNIYKKNKNETKDESYITGRFTKYLFDFSYINHLALKEDHVNEHFPETLA